MKNIQNDESLESSDFAMTFVMWIEASAQRNTPGLSGF